MKTIIRLSAICLVFLALAATAMAESPEFESNALSFFPSPITNFGMVSPGIYRGALPVRNHVQFLKERGIKTILTLDGNKRQIAAEKAIGAALRIPVVSIPMSFFWRPRSHQVNAALALIRDRRNHPIYVHCHGGKDRTGLIIGLHRVENEGWSPEAAFNEMLRYGFHEELWMMKDYFEWRTGTDL